MVEHVERVKVETQPVALMEGELLAERHIKPHLKGRTEDVPAGGSEERFIDIRAGRVSRGHAIRSGSNKLRVEIVGVQNRVASIYTSSALELRLPCGNAWLQGDDRVGKFDVGAEVQAPYRTGVVINAVGLSALRHGLAAEHPVIHQISESFIGGRFRQGVAIIDQKDMGLIEVRRGIAGLRRQRVVTGEDR